MLWSKIERERVNMCSCAALVGTATGIIGECNGRRLALENAFHRYLVLHGTWCSPQEGFWQGVLPSAWGLLDRVAHFCMRSHEAKQSKVKLKVGESSIMDCALN